MIKSRRGYGLGEWQGWEDLRGDEKGKNIVIYYMKKIFFSVKNKSATTLFVLSKTKQHFIFFFHLNFLFTFPVGLKKAKP